MFDAEAEGIDDLESGLKISVNKALSYLWNYQPWSFRVNKQTLKIKPNRNYYNTPNGIISRKVVSGKEKYGVKYNGKSLEYLEEHDSLEQKTGEPESFWIDGEYIYIYPTPDNTYQLELDYLLLPYGINDEDEPVYELKEEDDRVNIPEKYEKVFKNCLISLAMMYAIADESDENYSGYKKQYEDALAVLFKYCKDKLYNRKITW